jgi:hypothetical protein
MVRTSPTAPPFSLVTTFNIPVPNTICMDILVDLTSNPSIRLNDMPHRVAMAYHLETESIINLQRHWSIELHSGPSDRPSGACRGHCYTSCQSGTVPRRILTVFWLDSIHLMADRYGTGTVDGTSVADPGSGAFLTPGSGIRNRFFPDLGSRIPDPKPIF